MFYEIPLTQDPDQNFNCSILLLDKNISLYFRVRYNSMAKYWVVTVSDSSGNILLDSIPLITGIDLLEQFKHLGIGSAIIVNVGTTLTDSPDDTSLGSRFKLLWGEYYG